MLVGSKWAAGRMPSLWPGLPRSTVDSPGAGWGAFQTEGQAETAPFMRLLPRSHAASPPLCLCDSGEQSQPSQVPGEGGDLASWQEQQDDDFWKLQTPQLPFHRSQHAGTPAFLLGPQGTRVLPVRAAAVPLGTPVLAHCTRTSPGLQPPCPAPTLRPLALVSQGQLAGHCLSPVNWVALDSGWHSPTWQSPPVTTSGYMPPLGTQAAPGTEM